jgi:hypothetical protein
MQQLPISLARNGIDVLLAQKADVIRILQLINGGGILPHFAVVELNGALVLIAAMNGLHFFLALDFLADLRRGDGQRYQDESRDEQQTNQ